MKMIDDPRWKSEEALRELASDPRTMPMLKHYLIEAAAERSECRPEDEPAYDALVARLSHAINRGSQ